MNRFLSLYGERLVHAVCVHLVYVIVSICAAFVIAFFLGILLSRLPRLATFFLIVLSLFQTIPGIVFIGILFLYNGMRPSTVIIALTIYAVFPILKNTFAGLRGVEERYREAARGCGMSPVQVIFKIEIPMALPYIISGLRISAIYTISWAVLAAMIGLGGLGEFIYAGVSSNNNALIFGGAIPAALMAILFGILIDVLRRVLIPKPLRGEKQ